MATSWTNKSESSAPTWKNFIVLGLKEYTVGDLGDFQFDEVVTVDGRTLGELTFDDLQAISWTNKQEESSI